MPEELQWTLKPPKEAGWYWCRNLENGAKGILQLGLYPVPQNRSDRPITDDDFREWAGPIPEPQPRTQEEK